jgi:hypothetical protein
MQSNHEAWECSEIVYVLSFVLMFVFIGVVYFLYGLILDGLLGSWGECKAKCERHGRFSYGGMVKYNRATVQARRESW